MGHYPGGDHRHASGHVFEQFDKARNSHLGKIRKRQQSDISSGQHQRDLFMRDRRSYFDGSIAHGLGVLLQFVSLWPIPDYLKSDIQSLLSGQADRVYGSSQIPFGAQYANVHQPDGIIRAGPLPTGYRHRKLIDIDTGWPDPEQLFFGNPHGSYHLPGDCCLTNCQMLGDPVAEIETKCTESASNRNGIHWHTPRIHDNLHLLPARYPAPEGYRQ